MQNLALHMSQAGKSKSWGYKSRPAFKLQVQVVPIVITSVRFAPATLPLKFSGVRQATSFGAVFPQQAITPPGDTADVSSSLSLKIVGLPLSFIVFLTNIRS